MVKEYDVIIIGGGAAGLTAGIYCSRAELKTLILEKVNVGGQILKTDVIENYPAFPEAVSGFELMEKMKTQAEKSGAEFAVNEVSGISSRAVFQIETSNQEKYCCKAVIVATGANPKKLGIKGEIELTGRGVSYCATCDGPFFRNKEVVIVGGGDTAVGEAIYLTRFVKKLTLVHRRDKLRAARILQRRLLNNEKAAMKLNSVPLEILGTDKVCGVTVKDVRTNKEEQIPANGVFIYAGIEPNTGFLKGIVELDDKGFIITNEKMETSVKGVFACGDVRKNVLKQVITAAAEGATAAYSCWHYIEGKGN